MAARKNKSLHSYLKIAAADCQYRGASGGLFCLLLTFFLPLLPQNICSFLLKASLSFDPRPSIIHPSVSRSVPAPLPHVSCVTLSLSLSLSLPPLLPFNSLWCVKASVLWIHCAPLLTRRRHGKCTHSYRSFH